MARVAHKNEIVAARICDFGQGLPMLSLMWQAAQTIAPGSSPGRRPQTSMRQAGVG